MADQNDSTPPSADLEQGTYEILKTRLEGHASLLRKRADSLNAERLERFGGTEMAIVGNERIRTENNCIPRDIRPVGDLLLFGYNVFLGLRTETKVGDVLSLHSFDADDANQDGRFEFTPLPADDRRNFLAGKAFLRDFEELYQYYKNARLLHLRRPEGRLLATFQVGKTLDDIRVFRWEVDPDGAVTYIDNRGERDVVPPPSHGFEWTETTRDNHVLGRHPHVSILDKVFVETVGGDLTVKVEDNTEDGLGIYQEDVDEPHQSLADARILYAEVGSLILIKVLPYNETVWRHLVFNTRTRSVERIDAIGQACQLLPEDHGLVFPGGYYLQDGTHKSFDGDIADMEFLRAVRSPNGEDVLYVFHERRDGRTILLNYNLIRKEVQNPIFCHGWALFDNGKLALFRAASDEPTRVHPMQIWQSAFVSDEFAARTPTSDSFLEKVGNAELVRGISDALSIHRAVAEQAPSVEGYEALIAQATRMLDAFYWLGDEAVGNLAQPLAEVKKTADSIVGEFQKVQTIRQQARDAEAQATEEIDELFHRLRSEPQTEVDHFVVGLAELRRRRGRLMTLRDLRYIDLGRLDELEVQLVERFDSLSQETVAFLLDPKALRPYHEEIDEQVAASEAAEKTLDLHKITERLGEMGDGLELLTEVVSGLSIDDPTQRTEILESIAEVLGGLNRARAVAEARRKELLSIEGRAEFGAQFQLFAQSVSGALALADAPESCDEQLSKLMLQLEDLEARFGEIDDTYQDQLTTQREDVYEAFSSKKQTLLDERQRKAGRMLKAADRILDGVRRRAASQADAEALATYFVGDAMVQKLRDLTGSLRELGETVKADELESRLKSAREEAARSIRDKADLFESGEGGGEVIRLGRHRFSVNTQAFDLTMVPRTDRTGDTVMAFHLTGTDFYDTIDDADFLKTRGYWDQLVVSETDTVYRAEYLAASILLDAEEGLPGPTIDQLHAALIDEEAEQDGLLRLVRKVASDRYDEGYERGLHDHDAAKILEELLAMHQTAGLLRFAPRPRALACLFWAFFGEQTAKAHWERRSRSLARLRSAFSHSTAIQDLSAELSSAIVAFVEGQGVDIGPDEAALAGSYLFEELSKHPVSFTTSGEAIKLRDTFLRHLDLHHDRRAFDEDLRELQDDLEQRYRLAVAWLRAYLDEDSDEADRATLRPSLDEAAVLLLTERRLDRTPSSAIQHRVAESLLGQHPRIRDRQMELRLDEFLARLTAFRQTRAPGFRDFQERRHGQLERERDRLRLDEYRPKVMSAFVRNKLISEAYLPLIGDNLAKQLGAVGASKRTDQMGLLLLISPPGYGKTTLMEYVANRLGLIFVKVNGPALGHSVTSLDPSEAPNATARQEVDKINFALEMGNNVLLYLDDIQHTHSELLQKFISMCDAQRRMEGVWNGKTRTYDLKGKRFAVCMAGNPYTESGEAFQIPDMLANRADTYNLGDILEGQDEVFALSYIENSLTSNPVLAPLTTRDPDDVYKLVAMAQGEAIQADQLGHGYSQVELEEILDVLRKLLRLQQVVLAVNQQYIASAAQEDAFRTEPRFQLQGSYRNMNKLAEKVVAVMNDRELETLIDDHYAGESQTLTTGAEANVLKLAELRGTLSDEQAARWDEIKRGFQRVQAMGGADDDPAVQIIGQLGLVGDRLSEIGKAIQAANAVELVDEQIEAEADGEPAIDEPDVGTRFAEALGPYLGSLRDTVEALAVRPEPSADSNQETKAWAELAGTIGDRLDRAIETLVELVAQRPVMPAVPPAVPAAAEKQPAASAPSAAPSTDLGPYLEQLGNTMQALAESRPSQVVQTLTPGVIDLFDRLAESIDDDLMPAVKVLDQIRKHHAADDKRLSGHLNRTLRHLDHLRELVLNLRRIDTTRLTSD